MVPMSRQNPEHQSSIESQKGAQTSGQPAQMGGQTSQMGGQTAQTGQMATQSGQSMQMGGQSSQMGQTQARLPQQIRTALMSVAEAIEVCEWCADQCIQEANPEMIECIRLCEDVSELGEATQVLTARQSRYGQSVARSFLQAVQACAQECARHQASHCQECAQVLQQTAQQCQQLLQGASQQTTQ